MKKPQILVAVALWAFCIALWGADRIFGPTGNTVVLAATGSVMSGVQVTTSAAASVPMQYRVVQNCAPIAYVNYGSTASVSAPVPTSATSSPVIPVLSGTAGIFSAPPNSFWTATTSTGSCNVLITPGFGGN